MASSLISQLKAVQSLVLADTESLKRPIIRPSILYSAKEAADVNIDTIFSVAIIGLEALIATDERFREYKSNLFSYESKERDRELMGKEDNDHLDTQIREYLWLLSGYLQLPASKKTLEYLIRRYKIHVHNMDDLIICALPYHETHVFVDIVQLLNTRNSKWKFLDGVKSGAPPPRSVIVQQCVRDMGLLETLCGCASETREFRSKKSQSKKLQVSRPMISFCTAVIVEVLGFVKTIDSDIVKRIMPFVQSGLQLGTQGGSDHQAGALMIVGLVANKTTLNPDLVKQFIRLITEIAGAYANGASDPQWVRLSLIALVNFVQLQPVDLIDKKPLEVLSGIRDIARMLLELSKEFSVDRFLTVLLNSLAEHSSSGELYRQALISIIETVPISNLVDHLVFKFLASCMKLSQKSCNSASSESGSWAKKVLIAINMCYPTELSAALCKFLKDTNFQLDKNLEMLCNMLDGDNNKSLPFSDSKIWFRLHHPMADVRRKTLSRLKVSEVLKADTCDKSIVNVRDAIVRQLYDDDMAVVKKALSLDRFSEIITSSDLLKAMCHVLHKCANMIMSSPLRKIDRPVDVASLFFKIGSSSLHDQIDYSKKMAALILPFLLLRPKTWKLSLTVLETAKELDWPYFKNLVTLSSDEMTEPQTPECISSYNMVIVTHLAEEFVGSPGTYMPWLIESCNGFISSKTLIFLTLLKSFSFIKNDRSQVLRLFEVCFPVLQKEWIVVESAIAVPLKELQTCECINLVREFVDTDTNSLNTKILICLFWKILEAFIQMELPPSVSSVDDERSVRGVRNLFTFFADSHSKHIFKEHIHYLVRECKVSPVCFLSSLFLEGDVPFAVQIESLHCFSYLCSLQDNKWCTDLLAEFPSILVPLSSDNQDVRFAAMGCVEGLQTLWERVDFSSKKNGNTAVWSRFLYDLLVLIVQNSRLVLSNEKYLSSFMTSLLGSSSNSLLVPRNVEERFDQNTKEQILGFILGTAFPACDKVSYPAYGKLRILSLLKGLGDAVLHVKDVESLLSILLERRSQYHSMLDKPYKKLSQIEVQILCVLLECCTLHSSPFQGHALDDYLLKALQINCPSSGDGFIIYPCLTILEKLSNQVYGGLKTEIQESLFRELVHLFRCTDGNIQNATKEALLRIKISDSTVLRSLDLLLQQENFLNGPFGKQKKKKSADKLNSDLHRDNIYRGEKAFYFLASLLDVLLLKKDIVNRESFIGPLFRVVNKFQSQEWVSSNEPPNEPPSGHAEANSTTICFIQQTLLLVLKDICDSLVSATPLKNEIVNEINVAVLVELAQSVKDGVTRNHIFLLLSSIAKIAPAKVLDHITNILTVIGESTVSQIDSHSQHVFEDFISTVVPLWLTKTKNADAFLQIFVNILPDVAEHRRLSIVSYLLRTMGECNSLASLLVLLFDSLVSRKGVEWLGSDKTCVSENFVSLASREWEFTFAVQVCEQFSCMIWLPSLMLLLQRIEKNNPCLELFAKLRLVMEFILQKLQHPEFAFKLKSGENSDVIQIKLKEMMDGVISLFHFYDLTRKQIRVPSGVRMELKMCMKSVLRTLTSIMIPSTYFDGIINILQNADNCVREKVLGLLCETVKDPVKLKQKGKKVVVLHTSNPWLHLDEMALESFGKLCLVIIHLVDEANEELNTSLKLAALSTLEVLASRFPSNHSVFSTCLKSVSNGITSDNMAVSSCCLRTSGALINLLGPKALAELPIVMTNVISKSREISCLPVKYPSDDTEKLKKSLLSAILVTLEAVIDNLGGFLNPFLGDLIELMVIRSEFVLESDLNLKVKADAVRKLLMEKIPVRLTLQPLLKICNAAVNSGDSSLVIAFEMLGSLVGKMDRFSVSGYHGKIFDQCLHGLDLRRLHPVSIQDINVVERTIINAMVSLSMKLTETMFKPLFIRSIEWAESEIEDNSGSQKKSICRIISFYGLVNKLAENHRSLFVPYFKYLLEGCVRYLDDYVDEKSSNLIQKKKKVKIQERSSTVNGEIGQSLKNWHLRALVVSSLHKCFLYDTGNLKFLDSNNFQALLKPLVSQLVVDPPASLEENQHIPSVQEVDDLLVTCIGQMAVTVGSDLLWKPLNHEVLMQTRSEKMRARILGLRIVRKFMENLKEEYLVFLAETIPFLGELLEDMELPVKSMAQDILQEMEFMSGENIRDFL